ncbi:MAG TPA: hypothetical protein DHW49_08080 [Anaerolineae bacterium]|mgnify:CR=1 FL=1|nr:hypothetical protein [Anaerolineae bacterium]
MLTNNKPTEDHINEVSRILRNFNQPDEWKDSYWLSSYLVKDYLRSGQAQTPYQAVRATFSDILNLLLDESPYYGDILKGRFWEGQHVAQMVKNGRPQYWEERTFYIYQKKAIARFTALLWEREQICQKTMLQSKPKYIEFLTKNRITIINTLFFSMIALLFIVFDKVESLPSRAYSESTLTLASPDNILFPTSTNSKIIFQENFEDGTADNFRNKLGLWVVVSEPNGNKVLDINSMDSSIEYPTIEFGESDWRNFILTSRINVVDYSDSNDAPLVSIRFSENYKLTFTPYWNGVELVFEPLWEIVNSRTLEIHKNKWYSISIKVQDSKIDIFFENKLIISDELSNAITGFFGFATWPEAHVQFDDVFITLIE